MPAPPMPEAPPMPAPPMPEAPPDAERRRRHFRMRRCHRPLSLPRHLRLRLHPSCRRRSASARRVPVRPLEERAHRPHMPGDHACPQRAHQRIVMAHERCEQQPSSSRRNSSSPASRRANRRRAGGSRVGAADRPAEHRSSGTVGLTLRPSAAQPESNWSLRSRRRVFQDRAHPLLRGSDARCWRACERVLVVDAAERARASGARQRGDLAYAGRRSRCASRAPRPGWACHSGAFAPRAPDVAQHQRVDDQVAKRRDRRHVGRARASPLGLTRTAIWPRMPAGSVRDPADVQHAVHRLVGDLQRPLVAGQVQRDERGPSAAGGWGLRAGPPAAGRAASGPCAQACLRPVEAQQRCRWSTQREQRSHGGEGSSPGRTSPQPTSRGKSPGPPGVGSAHTSSSRKSWVSSWMRQGREVCACRAEVSSTCCKYTVACHSTGRILASMPAPTRTPRSAWIDAGLPGARRRRAGRGAHRAARPGARRHPGRLLLALRGPRALLEELLDTWERRSTDEVLERVESEGGDPRDKVRRAGMLTFSRACCPSTSPSATGPGATRPVAAPAPRRQPPHGVPAPADRRLRRDPPTSRPAAMLAFALAIGNHFIAADHGPRSRPRVLERATRRLLA